MFSFFFFFSFYFSFFFFVTHMKKQRQRTWSPGSVSAYKKKNDKTSVLGPDEEIVQLLSHLVQSQ